MSSGGYTVTNDGFPVAPGYQPVSNHHFHSNPPPPSYTPSPQYAQGPQYAGGSAPPYYPQEPRAPLRSGYSAQQQNTNVVVVQQSAGVIPVVARPVNYQPDAGHAALMFAMIITVFSLIFGCWWGIICSIPGIVFANAATSAGFRGDQESVRSNNNLSYGATVASIVSSVIGVGIFLGLVFGIWYRPYYLL